MNNRPTGTVTFLFTDIEGSTKLAREHPDKWEWLRERHHSNLREAIESNKGYVFQIIGDAFCAAFHQAGDALQAALQAQTEFLKEARGEAVIKVRMGIHAGAAKWMGKDHEPEYQGYATLAMSSRVMSAGHGGQILVSHNAYELAKDKSPVDSTFMSLGEYSLKDFSQAQEIHQLTAPDLQSNFPPLKTLKTVQNNLPLNLTSFIGRERELAEAQGKLASARLLTMIGPGGTGKTRLSLQVAAEQIGRFKNGVWFVEFAPINDPAFIVLALAGVFNLREVQGTPLLETVTDYLRAKEALLIFDNCEHLVEASAKLTDHLLHACPQLKIIASSREALGINGETVYRVPSLQDDEATRLFIERATKANSHFQATETNASFIAQICSRLDGIPLALELAAARVNLFSPQQIAERLDDRFKLLTGGSRTALPRQQTLRALIDWSYQTLNGTEQRALRRLAVFSGGWTFEAAEVVVGESEALDGLAGLVSKSLVNVEGQDGKSRYSFLETIRQYGLEKLSESDEAAQIRDKHFNYFFEFANQFNEQAFGERVEYWVTQFELENDNLRSALRWGMDHHLLKAVNLLRYLSEFWLLQGSLTEGQTWCDLVIEKLKTHPESGAGNNRASAYAHHVMALMANNQGRHAHAREHVEIAILLFKSLGETKDLARSLMTLSTASGFSGDLEKAFEAVNEGIRISRAADLKFELSWGLEILSELTFLTRGQAGEKDANALMEERIALLEEINYPWRNNVTKAYLARLAFARGEIETARKYANEVITDLQEAGAILPATSFKSDIAHALRRAGNFTEAALIYRETILAYQEIGHRGAIAHQLECFAHIATGQEQGERAVKLLSAANALRERVNSRRTPQEQMEYETQIATLRAGLGEEDFNRRWETGKSMTIEQAIDYALEATHD